jgi:hypothetical protein
MLPRLHRFEIAEQSWCPRAIRESLTDELGYMSDAGRVYAPAAPLLADVLPRTASACVVDLGAGGGGPWRSLLPALAEHQVVPRVRLTDRFPNREAFERVARDTNGVVSGDERSIDATDVPADRQGMRTIFSSLLHLCPNEVQQVLGDAAARGVAIGAFDATRRDVKTILLMLLTPLFVLLVTASLRPFRVSQLFWTCLVPAIPLAVLFDGLVSCLRTYTTSELRTLTTGLGGDDDAWRVGAAGTGPVPMTYVVGAPREASCLTTMTRARSGVRTFRRGSFRSWWLRMCGGSSGRCEGEHARRFPPAPSTPRCRSDTIR